jgi:hypothetical protein
MRERFRKPNVNTEDDVVSYAQNYYDWAKPLLGLTSDPIVMFDFDEQEESNPLKQKTGLFNPDNNSIIIFCSGRHAKDVVRSFAHELVHCKQNLDGTISDEVKQRLFAGADIDDPLVQSIEGPAYRNGSFMLRKFAALQEALQIHVKKTQEKNSVERTLPKAPKTPKGFVELEEMRGALGGKKVSKSGFLKDRVVEFDHKFQDLFSPIFEKANMNLANYYEPGGFYEYVAEEPKSSVVFSIFPCGDDEYDTDRKNPILQVTVTLEGEKKTEDHEFETLYALYRRLSSVLKQRKVAK